jgi:hypothetical protein
VNRILLLGVLMLATACEDPVLSAKADSLGRDQGPYEAGPLHRAGDPCGWCHAKGGKAHPYFDVAGTIYAHQSSSEALPGALIHLFDRHGKQVTLQSNQTGNFFAGEGELGLEFPLWVAVERDGKTTKMITPIFRERSCSACHLEPQSPSSAGRVFLWEDP